ncbi:hypothetical protein TWF132_003916 [Orbilia oligospora]|nr:hypothetical protein TWF132_003916 [Orbilia oligospora]
MPPNEFERYTILIVCPLGLEAAAMKRFFDEEYKMHAMSRDDVNVYTLGKIGKHFVAMATPSDTGLTSAATLATDAWRTFKKLRFTLLVGVAAGIPLRGRGIELGDVVVGKRICQYDWKRELGNGKYELIGHLNNPPATLSQIAKRVPEEEAHIFVTNLLREKLDTEEFKRPTIHYGVIASGNSLVRDASFRDQILEKERDALCIEMEGAGLTNKHHCLAIRGISDFGDEHKDDIWQRRAARAAAAVATYILSECPPFDDDPQREEQWWWVPQSSNAQQTDMPLQPHAQSRQPTNASHSQFDFYEQSPQPSSRAGYGARTPSRAIPYQGSHNPFPHPQPQQRLPLESGLELDAQPHFFENNPFKQTHQLVSIWSQNSSSYPAMSELSDWDSSNPGIKESIEESLEAAKGCIQSLEQYDSPNEFRSLIMAAIKNTNTHITKASSELSLIPEELNNIRLNELAGHAKILSAVAIFAELNLMWYDRKENTETFGQKFRTCHRHFEDGQRLVGRYRTANASDGDYKRIANQLAKYLKDREWAVEAAKKWLD